MRLEFALESVQSRLEKLVREAASVQSLKNENGALADQVAKLTERLEILEGTLSEWRWLCTRS